MASIDVAKLLNKITQDIPGINTVLKALAKWDVSALTDVPDGAMQATTDANNNLTIKKKVSGSYTPVAKLLHDVDKLDGYHASASATANTVAVRNASGALPGNILGNAVTADTATALAAGSVVPVNQGGTGATTASQARANLGVAGSSDFTEHIAKQASPSVEGHVKLDAFAADGSNTAAPGGYGWGKTTGKTVTTTLNTCLEGGFYNLPSNPQTAITDVAFPSIGTGPMLVVSRGNLATQFYFCSGSFAYRQYNTSTGVWSDFTVIPKGITDSTATTSSTVAASATAVKAVNDAAVAAQTTADSAATAADYATTKSGTSSTASATAAKAVTCAGFKLSTNARIFVTFSNANTVAGAITLNVNGTGAKSVYNQTGIISASNTALFAANQPIEFRYDGTGWVFLASSPRYELGEVYYFRHPTLRPGFQPCQGGVITNAATQYPQIWAYLQTTDGKLLCKTEAQWQAMTTATWHTNADGTKVGWNGIGGAPFYVQDLAAGTLRMPDLRGMYAEAAGFDSLDVGGVHGDMIRNIVGKLYGWNYGTTGAFSSDSPSSSAQGAAGAGYVQVTLDPHRVVPVGAANKPRAWGALACCYLGQAI